MSTRACSGVVLLASQLLNTPRGADRLALLSTAERHPAPAVRLIVEWHLPSCFDRAAAGVAGRWWASSCAWTGG